MGFGHEVWSNILVYSVDQTKFQLAAKMVFPKGFKSRNSESVSIWSIWEARTCHFRLALQANGEFTRLKGTSGAWRWVARSYGFGSFGCGSKSRNSKLGWPGKWKRPKPFCFLNLIEPHPTKRHRNETKRTNCGWLRNPENAPPFRNPTE